MVEPRLRGRPRPERPQRFLKLVRHILHHGVGHVENRRIGPVITLQLQNAATGPTVRELHDILKLRAAPRVNALEIIPHHHDVAVSGGDQIRKLGLQRVRILIFIHQNMQEVLLQERANLFVFDKQAVAVDEQIVKIHRAQLLLLRLIRAADRQNRRRIKRHLRLIAQNLPLQIALAVRRVRNDLQQQFLLGKFLRVFHMVLDALAHELLLVILVQNRKIRLVSQTRSVPAQKTRANVMEGAAVNAVQIRHQLPGAFQHLARRAVRERQQQDPRRRHPLFDQIRDAVYQRTRFPRSGGGQHQHRPFPGRGRRTLFCIEHSTKIRHGEPSLSQFDANDAAPDTKRLRRHERRRKVRTSN